MIGKLKLVSASMASKEKALKRLAEINSKTFELEAEQEQLTAEIPSKLIAFTGPGVGAEKESARLDAIKGELNRWASAAAMLSKEIARFEEAERVARIEASIERARAAGRLLEGTAMELQKVLGQVASVAVRLHKQVHQFAQEVESLPRDHRAKDWMPYELSHNLGRLISLHLHVATNGQVKASGVVESVWELQKSGIDNIAKRATGHVFWGLRDVPSDEPPKDAA